MHCIVYWTHFQNIHTFTYKKTVITKTTDESQTSHRQLQTGHRRVTNDYRRVTDESQTATEETQKTTDKSQTSQRQLQTSHRQLETNLRRMQLSHKLLQATRTTEVHFQPLTWFNKFICRPSDIWYYAIWFVYETLK